MHLWNHGRSVAFLAWLFLCSIGPSGQAADRIPIERDFLVRVWRKEHGLPENQVLKLMVARDGFLWVGTRRGIARFDGTAFQVLSRSTDPNFESDSCTALAEAEDGQIWIGTPTGLLRVSNRHTPSGSAVSVQTNVLATFKAQLQINALLVTHQNLLVVATAAGLFLRSPEGRWTQALTAKREGNWNFLALTEDSNGAVWAGTTTQLYQMDPTTAKLEPRLQPDQDQTAQAVNALAAGPDGIIYAAVGLRDFRAQLMSWDHGETNVLLDQPVWNSLRPIFLYPDSEGNLWFPLGSGSLACKSAKTLRVYDLEKALGPFAPVCITEDRDHNLWVATDRGIACLQRRSVKYIQAAHGLPNENTWTLLETRDGALWVGTDGGVTRFHEESLLMLNEKSGIARDRVRALAEDSRRTVWIGTASGLSYWDGHQAHSLQLAGDWFRAKTRALLTGRDGSVWVGAAQGLHRIRPQETNSWYVADGLPHDDVCALLEDHQGTLWIGTDGGGLASFRDSRFEAFGEAQGLVSRRVWALCEAPVGDLWIGTDRGLHCLRRGKVRVLTTQQGLPANLINSIVADDRGFLWIGHDSGIYRVALDQLNDFLEHRCNFVRCISYSEEDGLLSLETNGQKSQPASLRLRDGRIAFTSPAGIAVFNPTRLPDVTNAPIPHIEFLQVGGAQLQGDAARPEQEPVKVPAELQRRVDIGFTAPNFRNGLRTSFRYRLLGMDDVWVDAGSVRKASFAQLPPGNYTFEVVAGNSHGYWSSGPARISFHLEPRFYERRTIQLGSITGLASLLFLAIRRRLRELRQIHALEHLAGLEQERRRLARDLHDGLGSNLTEISLLSGQGAVAKPGGASAQERFSLLQARSAEAMDSLRELIWTTNPAADSLDAFSGRLCEQAERTLKAAGIRCRLQVPQELPAISLGPRYRRGLLLAAQEALHNAVRHAKAQTVTVGVHVDEADLRVWVWDDGVGFDTSVVSANSAPALDRGLGLGSMAKRIEELGGSCEIESRPRHGTAVRLRLPLTAIQGHQDQGQP